MTQLLYTNIIAIPFSNFSVIICSKYQEEEEEELTPLSPPPTLSITEEILEFINQSRAREGLTFIHANTTVRKHSNLYVTLKTQIFCQPDL